MKIMLKSLHTTQLHQHFNIYRASQVQPFASIRTIVIRTLYYVGSIVYITVQAPSIDLRK